MLLNRFIHYKLTLVSYLLHQILCFDVDFEFNCAQATYELVRNEVISTFDGHRDKERLINGCESFCELASYRYKIAIWRSPDLCLIPIRSPDFDLILFNLTAVWLESEEEYQSRPQLKKSHFLYGDAEIKWYSRLCKCSMFITIFHWHMPEDERQIVQGSPDCRSAEISRRFSVNLWQSRLIKEKVRSSESLECSRKRPIDLDPATILYKVNYRETDWAVVLWKAVPEIVSGAIFLHKFINYDYSWDHAVLP